METYKQQFIEFMVDSGVLTFGDFITKSERKTPFFINTGNYRTGDQMRKLGEFYAQAVINSIGTEFDVLFGPAYKGIPLAVATAIALSASHGKDAAVCYNRKEAKDHGEGGTLIGHKPKKGDRVLIIEDVTTSGASIRETVPVLKAAADITLAGLVVSVDRKEKGTSGISALKEVQEQFSMPATAIVTIDDIVNHLYGKDINGKILITEEIMKRINEYRAQYGV